MQRKKSKIAQTIDDALHQYYVVSKVRNLTGDIKDAEWWIEYLKSLGILGIHSVQDTLKKKSEITVPHKESGFTCLKKALRAQMPEKLDAVL